MKASELRALSLDELEEKAKERRKTLFNARVRHSTGQLENTARMRQVRRDIARIQTIARQKQASEAKA